MRQQQLLADKMSTPSDIENLRAVFEKILQQKQLKPKDIKPEKSKMSFSSRGRFDCHCGRSWESNFSWVRFDLVECEIIYRWKMKCRHCLSTNEPTFALEQLEEMFRRVVCIYKGENPNTEIDIGHRARRNFKDPHMPMLCEKCQWGAEQCWNRKYHYWLYIIDNDPAGENRINWSPSHCCTCSEMTEGNCIQFHLQFQASRKLLISFREKVLQKILLTWKHFMPLTITRNCFKVESENWLIVYARWPSYWLTDRGRSVC